MTSQIKTNSCRCYETVGQQCSNIYEMWAIEYDVHTVEVFNPDGSSRMDYRHQELSGTGTYTKKIMDFEVGDTVTIEIPREFDSNGYVVKNLKLYVDDLEKELDPSTSTDSYIFTATELGSHKTPTITFSGDVYDNGSKIGIVEKQTISLTDLGLLDDYSDDPTWEYEDLQFSYTVDELSVTKDVEASLGDAVIDVPEELLLATASYSEILVNVYDKKTLTLIGSETTKVGFINGWGVGAEKVRQINLPSSLDDGDYFLTFQTKLSGTESFGSESNDFLLEVGEIARESNAATLTWPANNIPENAEAYIRLTNTGNADLSLQPWEIATGSLLDNGDYQINFGETLSAGSYDFELLYIDKDTHKELSSAAGSFVVDYDQQDAEVLDATFNRTVSGRETRTLYDINGTLQAAVSAEGAVTEFVYNGIGQLVHTIAYGRSVDDVALHISGSLTDILNYVRDEAAAPDAPETLHSYQFYNQAGQTIATVDAAGYVSVNDIDSFGRVVASKRFANAIDPTSADGFYQNLTSNHGIGISLTDLAAHLGNDSSLPADQITQTRYNDRGWVERTIDAQGVRTNLDYNALGQRIATYSGLNADGTSDVDDASRSHSQTLNANGQVREETVGDQQLKHHYDNNGLLTSTIILSDESGQGERETRFFYDANGRLVFSLNANNELEEIRYNAFGEAIGTQVYAERLHDERLDLEGIQGGIASAALLQYLRGFRTDSDSRNHLRYDRRGQLRAQVDANGNSMNYEYNAFGEKARDIRTAQGGLINDKDIITEYTRDLIGRIISTSKDALGLGQSNSVQYDTFGRIKTAQDGNGNISSYEYDALGRQVSFNATVDGTSETLSTTTYDAFGRILTQTDAENTKTIYQYNDSDRSITITAGVTSTQSGVSETTWTNRHGETRLVQNSLGEQTRYEYDLQGQLVGVYRNDEADVLNRYYESGLLEETEDATGQIVRYEYDASSRLIRQTVNPDNTPAVTEYQYNAKGQQIQEKRWLTASNAVNPDFILTTTAYDSKGQISAITVEGDTDKDDVTTAFAYDDQGRQLTISTGGHGGIGYETNDDGQLVRVYSAPLHQVRYEYDSLGRRISETVDPDVHDSIDGNLLYRGLDITTVYRYDDNNNVIQVIDANGALTTQYYDELNRNTISVNALGEINEQTYDLKGNLIASRVRTEAVQVFGLSGGYSTDEVMSRLSATTNPDDQLTQFVFNERNQLKYVIDAEGGVTESIYDSVGRVVESVKHDVSLMESGVVTVVATDVNSDVRVKTLHSLLESAGSLTKKFWIDEGNKYFGQVLSASDDFIVLGSQYDDEMGVNAGAVEIFKREGEQWVKDQKLFASDGYSFGRSIAIDGNRIIAGALGDDSSVFVFERNAEGWHQQAKLVAEDGSGDFGTSLAISGDRIIVGAKNDDVNGNNSGSAYIFELQSGDWQQVEKLVASDGQAYDYFGHSVAINGDNIAIGAYSTDHSGPASGSVYTYTRGESGWETGATLEPEDLAPYDRFGFSISMSNERLVVGAYYANAPGMLDTGSAYVYVQNSSEWVIEDKLMATDLEAGALFGTSVAISGDRIVVGAIMGGESGAAYVFERDGESWSENTKLENVDARVDSQFGYTVALTSDTLIAGSPFDDKNFINEDFGSVSFFSLDTNKRTSHTLYNSLGQAQYVTDPLGQVSENIFDRSGRLLRTVEYAQSYSGANTFEAINAWSTNLRDSDINNRHTWTVYNSLGQAEINIDSEGWVTQNEYDLAGRVTVQRTFRDTLDITPYVTNGLLDQTAVLDWATQQVKQWKDNVNAAAEGAAFNTVILEALRETRTTFDNAGRIIAITDALGETETFTYDQAGNRTSMTNKLGDTWTYIYDAANRLVREVSPQVEQTRVQGEVWSQDFTENTDGLTGTALSEGAATLDVTLGSLILTSNVPEHIGLDPYTLTTDEYRPSHYQWQVDFSVDGNITNRQSFIGIKGEDSNGEPRSIGLNLSVLSYDPARWNPKVEYQSSGDTELVIQDDLILAVGQDMGVDGLALETQYTLGFVVSEGEMTLTLHRSSADGLVLVGSYAVQGNWDDLGTNSARSHLEITHGVNDVYPYSLTIHNIQQTVLGEGWAEWAATNTAQTVVAPIYTDYKYDAMGNSIQVIEAAGSAEERITDAGFDRLGRQVITWHNSVGTYHEAFDTSTSSNYINSIRQEITQRPTERTWIDTFGNEVAHRNQLGDYSFKIYDDTNRLSYEIDAEGYVTGYTYNALGDQVGLTRYAQQLRLPTGQEPEDNYQLSDLDVIKPFFTGSDEAADNTLFAELNGESIFALAAKNDRFTLSHGQFDAWLKSETSMVDNTANRGLTTSYNALGQQLSVTESSVYSVHYNAEGVLEGSEQQAETQFFYNRWGEVIDEWTLDGVGNEIHQQAFYDQAGRQIATVNGENYLTTFVYDADDRLVEKTEYAEALSADWQSLGDLSAIKANALTTHTAAVDSVVEDNPLGFDRTVQYHYDAMGRQTQEVYRDVMVDKQVITTDGLDDEKRDVNYTREYQATVVNSAKEYDAQGNVIRNIDATGAATISYYDALGRVTAVIEPTRLSEVFDTSERLSLIHLDKATDKARLEWNTPAIAGATSTIEVSVEGSDIWYDGLTVVSDGYTSSVDVSELQTDRYEYRVTYHRDGESKAYGDAKGVVDIITKHQDAVTHPVSWVVITDDQAVLHVAGAEGVTVMLDGVTQLNNGVGDTFSENLYVFDNLDRGQYEIQIIKDAVVQTQDFQILKSDTITSEFAVLNSVYETHVDIERQQWYDYGKEKWRGENKFTIDFSDFDQLGAGKVTWSIDVEVYNARGDSSVLTYNSDNPDAWHVPGEGIPWNNHLTTPPKSHQIITSNDQGLAFTSSTDKSSKGRSAVVTRVVGMQLYKEIDGNAVKVIDSAGDARVERVEFLNVPITADAAQLHYRPTGSTSEQEYKTINLTKGFDGYFYTGANQFPRGRYDYEVYTQSTGADFSLYTSGQVDLRERIASQSEVDAGGSVAISPLTTYAYDVHGNRVQQTRHAAGAQGGFTDTDFSVETLENDQTSYWRYNEMGNVRQAQNAEQESEYYSYDAAGQLRKQWQRVTVNDQYGGTSNGTISQVNGNVYGYDRVGQIISEIQLRPNLDDPNIKHTEVQYTFSGFGEVVAKGQELGAGLQEYFDYDRAGRLIRTNQDTGVDRVYFYDRKGQMLSEMANNGSGYGEGTEVDLSVEGNVVINGVNHSFDNNTRDVLLGLERTRVMRSDFTVDQLGRVVKKQGASFTQNSVDRW